MNLIAWLLVGHLIGDWLLQNDWMATGKKQGFVTTAGITHFAIYTAVIMASAAIPLSGRLFDPFTFVAAVLFVFVMHWLIDATSLVEQWMHLFRQTDIPMVRVMVDQTFHVITLALIAQFLSV